MLKLPTLEQKEEKESKQPYLNTSYISSSDYGEPRTFNLNTLIYWVKRTPECIGVLKRIATDIVSNINFRAVDSDKPLVGRPPKSFKKDVEDKAVTFWEKNLGRQKLIAAVIDWLMTGDAYIWKGRISDNQLKEISLKHYNNFGIDLKELNINCLKSELKQFLDEDPTGISEIEIIPSSMVTIDHDDYKIKYFLQRATSNPSNLKRYSPDEIIHAKFLDIDGKVYGFSPMESDWMAIKTINAIQDFNYNYFANACKVDRAWLFMGNPSQERLDKHEEQLKKYNQVTYAHRDLIVAGADDIKIEPLNEISEEMGFRKVAISAVGRIAFSFNMPASSFNAILGGDIKSGGIGSDIEDVGYNRNIASAQLYWENLLNSQLWIPEFRVGMSIERTFRQDMVRKMQYLAMAVPHIEWMFKHDVPISDEYIYDVMQIDRRFITDGSIKRIIEEAKPFTPKVNKGNEAYSNQKKAEQKPQESNQANTGS